MTIRLDHTIVPAKDKAASARFFAEIFGLKVKPGRGYFAQVQVKEAKVDYGANCGNMSSAMGPFAVDEGLVKASGQEALVRVHNTNTKKIIWSRFPLDDGVAAVDGELAIPGVAGTGAGWRLHDVQASGTDPVVKGSTVAADAVTVPARTTAVFER